MEQLLEFFDLIKPLFHNLVRYLPFDAGNKHRSSPVHTEAFLQRLKPAVQLNRNGLRLLLALIRFLVVSGVVSVLLTFTRQPIIFTSSLIVS